MACYEDITFENLPNLMNQITDYLHKLIECVKDFAGTINKGKEDPQRIQIIARSAYYYRHLKLIGNLIAAKADYLNLLRIDLLLDKDGNYDEEMYKRYAHKVPSSGWFYHVVGFLETMLYVAVEIADTDGEGLQISDLFIEMMEEMTFW